MKRNKYKTCYPDLETRYLERIRDEHKEELAKKRAITKIKLLRYIITTIAIITIACFSFTFSFTLLRNINTSGMNKIRKSTAGVFHFDEIEIYGSSSTEPSINEKLSSVENNFLAVSTIGSSQTEDIISLINDKKPHSNKEINRIKNSEVKDNLVRKSRQHLFMQQIPSPASNDKKSHNSLLDVLHDVMCYAFVKVHNYFCLIS